ncbi:hypothetical protein QBC35DRAFT_510024 [Podospora australis]|uniref:Uncharacterized protein n=1 Tax=Podospora australis TaxID=1536484 RepID=A0AAN7ADW0_9PEZI|nr:hypothetical protein QBC35DRAFT_510024 [Podospora australis]
MMPKVFSLSCLSGLTALLLLANAQQTTTVPILDWGFDFPGSDVSVVGQESGSTTYRLTCEPSSCTWTQDFTQLTDGIVGTMTFVEGTVLYDAAMTQNISAINSRTHSYQATCTPRDEALTFSSVVTKLPNFVDCTSTSMGEDPTPTFPLKGTTVAYKMVVITQGVDKLSAARTLPATELVTVSPFFSQGPNGAETTWSTTSGSEETAASTSQPADKSAGASGPVGSWKIAGGLLIGALALVF